MIEKRILDKDKDFNYFSSMLDEYLNFLKTTTNPLYDYKDAELFCDWLKLQFKIRNKNDLIAIGSFEKESITKILISYKIEISWKKEIIENVIPYYVIGLMYFKNKSLNVPAEKISELDQILTDHFERQNFNKGFMTIKAPKFIINNTNGDLIDNYINNIFTKTFYGNRYTYQVETVIRSQEDLNKFKFKAFKSLLPKTIIKPIMLISFNLKNKFKKF